jgi:glycosyltransferase involved in cell wall biosynthesis
VEPIRVVHVLGGLEVGGAESRIMDIYRSIDRSNVQFDFVQHSDLDGFFSDEVKALGGRVFSVPRFRGRNLLEYRRAWRALLRSRPEWEILHAHATSTGFIYLPEAAQVGIRTRIAHARSTNRGAGLRRWTAKLARWGATDLFAVSRAAAVSEFGARRTNSGKVQILPNAIRSELYTFLPEDRMLSRRSLGIGEELALCHVGRFHAAKNHEFLLEVFAEVRQKRRDAHLFLVGDGPCAPEIKRRVSEYDLGNSVSFLGLRNDIPTLLPAFDGLVFPSKFEGFPGAVLEAQASGLPCIISDVISNEVCLTPLVKMMSLHESPQRWAAEVLRACAPRVRHDGVAEILSAGYDVGRMSAWYEEFYLSRANR